MKYETTRHFKSDYKHLTPEQRATFARVVREDFNPACDAFVRDKRPWPKGLRVRDIAIAKGIFEMTWEWPDGRATFEWAHTDDGERVVRWRRIGSHAVFRDP